MAFARGGGSDANLHDVAPRHNVLREEPAEVRDLAPNNKCKRDEADFGEAISPFLREGNGQGILHW